MPAELEVWTLVSCGKDTYYLVGKVGDTQLGVEPVGLGGRGGRQGSTGGVRVVGSGEMGSRERWKAVDVNGPDGQGLLSQMGMKAPNSSVQGPSTMRILVS